MMKKLSDYPAYKNYYQIVGFTKYRLNLFEDNRIRLRLKEIIEDIISRKEGVSLVEYTVAYNHVHILVQTELKPSDVAQTLFGASSRILRKEFPELVEKSEKALWGGQSWEAIKDERHYNNCVSYIRRHLPDDKKEKTARGEAKLHGLCIHKTKQMLIVICLYQ